MLLNCPPPASLVAPVATVCPIKFDQIQKIALGRSFTARFADEADLLLEATWTAAKALTTDEKIVITPFVSGLVFPASEAIKQGGNDNTTLNGVSEVMGGQMITVTFQLKNVSAATAESIRKIGTETMLQPGVSNIEAFFFGTNNSIIYNSDSAGTVVKGFPIYNLVVPDVASEGLNTNNTYNISFEMAFGWSRYWKLAVATWNPRSL